MKHCRLGIFALLTSMLTCASLAVYGQQQSADIRLNQVGFYPQGAKKAVVLGKASGSFYITTPNLADTLYAGKLGAETKSLHSDKTTRIADFTPFQESGTYVVVVPGTGHSFPFEVSQKVYHELTRAAAKAFYFQRASTALQKEHAGMWSRAAGHPDNKVLVHASAASEGRPAGTVLSCPLGWYDAGDYNKYIVNSGISTATMLSAYEDFPAYFDKLNLQLPESSNTLPDLLDEALWNLRWMLTMQDPGDGGVYHKLTTAEFEGMSTKPFEATAPRYVVKKSTAAALNFAAVMAQASRVFRKYDKAFPGFADSSLVAAKAAWEWAHKNPSVLYDQAEMNKQYAPAINTGAYGDNDVSDEFDWAAAELYLATKDDSYYKAIKLMPLKSMALPSWGQVRLLGYYSLARHEKELTPAARKDLPKLKAALVAFADQLVKAGEKTAYQVPMGGKARDFVWGSNAVAGNQGIALVQAYRLTKNQKYLNSALANLDYLLGRNATGYSYLTGYGAKTPMFPHHRLSVSDEVKEPIPGLLVGGPNPGQQDGCTYPTKIADESYIDEECSYASNEIAINWNAPFMYLASALEAMKHQAGYVQTKNK